MRNSGVAQPSEAIQAFSPGRRYFALCDMRVIRRRREGSDQITTAALTFYRTNDFGDHVKVFTKVHLQGFLWL
jgi:hypothetical protein